MSDAQKMDRQQWAENLILQLPPDHDGRNSWLLNYGRKDVSRKLRRLRGLEFDERSQAVNPPVAPALTAATGVWEALIAARPFVDRAHVSGTDITVAAWNEKCSALLKQIDAALTAPAVSGDDA